MYQCFHCGQYAVIWGADFDFEDYPKNGLFEEKINLLKIWLFIRMCGIENWLKTA